MQQTHPPCYSIAMPGQRSLKFIATRWYKRRQSTCSSPGSFFSYLYTLIHFNRKMPTAQFHDTFYKIKRSHYNEIMALRFGGNEKKIWCCQVTYDQIGIYHPQIQCLHKMHNYARIAGFIVGRKLYQCVRKDIYLSQLAVDSYKTIWRCLTRPQNHPWLRKNVRQLQHLSAKVPLGSVAIDVLGELIEAACDMRYLVITSGNFTKHTKSVSLKSVSDFKLAIEIVRKWVLNYIPFKTLLLGNGKRFKAAFLKTFYRILKIHKSIKTTYHPQKKDERFSWTLKVAIHRYCLDQPSVWDLCTQSSTYACNCVEGLLHTSTTLAPFDLVLSKPSQLLILKKHWKKYPVSHEEKKE